MTYVVESAATRWTRISRDAGEPSWWLDEIMQARDPQKRKLTREGLRVFVGELLVRFLVNGRQELGNPVIDAIIASFDMVISRQLDEILHHSSLRAMERAWRSVKLVVDHVDEGDNTEVSLLSVTRESLLVDFDESNPRERGLTRLLLRSTVGPMGLLVADFELGATREDVGLLVGFAEVAAAVHAPFIAGASPRLFRFDDFRDLERLPDGDAFMSVDGHDHGSWQKFRDRAESRYVGLVLPRILLRVPHHYFDGRPFAYCEDVGNDNSYVSDVKRKLLWGNGAFAFAVRVAQSFAEYGWYTGMVAADVDQHLALEVPVYLYELMGEIADEGPTDAALSAQRCSALAAEGLVPLRHGAGPIRFWNDQHFQSVTLDSAFSCRRSDLESTARWNQHLPEVLNGCRLGHYVRAMFDEWPTWSQSLLEQRLRAWLDALVAKQEHRLHGASVLVEERDHDAFMVHLRMQVWHPADRRRGLIEVAESVLLTR